MSVEAATETALAAATHLTDMDDGAVATLRVLAKQIDYLAANDGLRDDGKLDNVSVPTYLKYCESLGLTPAGRLKLAPAKDGGGGKLAQLRAVSGG